MAGSDEADFAGYEVLGEIEGPPGGGEGARGDRPALAVRVESLAIRARLAVDDAALEPLVAELPELF